MIHGGGIPTDGQIDAMEKRVNSVIISNRILPRYPFFFVLSILQTPRFNLQVQRSVKHFAPVPPSNRRVGVAPVVSIHLHPMTNDVQQGVTSLEKAKKIISSNKDILGGTPRFKGARLPVHDIAEMLANEDDVARSACSLPQAEGRASDRCRNLRRGLSSPRSTASAAGLGGAHQRT